MIISDKYSKRNANFELLRIISMSMVLILHFLSNCGFLSLNTGNVIKNNIPWIIEGICYVAVDCFVMLTGFFMYKSKFKLSKVLNLIFQVLFYSVITYFAGIIIFKNLIDFREVLKAFTPVISGKYWFISNYVLLLLISPFLNSLIENLNKKNHLILCIVLLFVFSFLPTVFYFSPALKFEKSYDIVWFIVLYFVSSFIGKYDIKIKKSKAFLFYIIFTAMIFISKIFLESASNISFIKIINELLNNNDSKFCYNYSSVFVFFSALFLIIIFKDVKIENVKIKKTINFTGSLVLTCYLLPDERIWNFVNPNNYTNNNFLIVIYSLIALVGIFIVCCLIELLRKNIFELIYKKINFEKKCDLIQKNINKKFIIISEKI